MITLSEIMRLVPDSFRDVARIDAQYSLLYIPLAASAANAKATVTTQDDSYFMATRIMAYATDTAAPPVELASPQATYTLQIASNNLMPDGNAVHVGTIITTSTKDNGGLEFSFPIWIPPATTLSSFVTNLTATAMNLRIVLEGVRFLTSVKGAMMNRAS